ncbi:MAG: transporter [Pseudomonadota bacterium]
MALVLAAFLPVIAITLLGDYLVKRAALGAGFGSVEFYLGAAFYAVSAVGLLIAMRHMTLAAVGVWYAILTILAMTALGTLVFGERLLPRELVGIALSFSALACMSRFG